MQTSVETKGLALSSHKETRRRDKRAEAARRITALAAALPSPSLRATVRGCNWFLWQCRPLSARPVSPLVLLH